MDRARKYFSCTDSERAVFEAAIKLAMVYHQFVGVPVTKASAPSLEKAITEAIRIQPWVVRAETKIDRAALRRSVGSYRYRALDGSMISVDVVTRYGSAEARCAMRYVKELGYPLMFIREVVSRGPGRRGPAPRRRAQR
ncbi:MAG: dihydroneopterin aldolase family protein [Thermoplasmatota archaeon]